MPPAANVMSDIEIRELLRKEAFFKLAPTNLYAYARTMRPAFYTDSRPYLLRLCNEIDDFLFNPENKKKFLIVSVPPRFGKSLTGQTASEYVFGRDPLRKIMTGSYNETLSTTFATAVRDTIAATKADEDKTIFSDIFPNTKIKLGDAAKDLWALEGARGKSYLATSPTGTATGFGTDLLIIDDIIKNATEALNKRILEERWNWFASTMIQRLEGDWKVMAIMTRWASGDIAGKIIEQYGDLVQVVSMPAINADGTMLCDDILTRDEYELKVQEMLKPIAEANYLQKPIDLEGQLYPDLLTFKPDDVDQEEWDNARTMAICDTADKGSDFLCLIIYKIINLEAYVVDVVFTQDDMDTTEELVADALFNNEVYRAIFESNNGGRLFSKNVERRILEKYGNNRTIIEAVTQTQNKEARILTSSAWVSKHVYMPTNWKARWAQFWTNVTTYQANAKNEHDDAPDVLASIFEQATGKLTPNVYNKAMTGMPTSSRRSRGSRGITAR